MKCGEDRNQESIGSCRKSVPCYKVAENLAELCPRVLWKREVISNELGYLAEEISEPSVKVMASFLLIA